MDVTRIPVPDGELAAWAQGSGRPMVVVHGGLGWDHRHLRPWLDPLAGEARLVYYDHRGTGRSGPPPDWRTFDPATWIDDIERVRDHLGADRILLLGHSYGGALAQEYAVLHPERVEGLVLCATAPAFDYVDEVVAAARSRATPEQMEALLGGLTAPPPDAAALAGMGRTVLPVYFHRWRPEHGEALLREAAYSPGAYEVVNFRYLPSFDVVEELHRIETPVLVLQGADDFICPPAQGERIAGRLTNAEVVVLDESGHFPFVEEPERFLETVRTWMCRLWSVGGGVAATPPRAPRTG